MDKHNKDTAATSPVLLGEALFDPIEMVIRDRVRSFIEALVDEELDEALGRGRGPSKRRAPSRHQGSGIAMVGGHASCLDRSGR